MRLIQSLLFVIGAACASAVGAALLSFLTLLMVLPTDRESGGALIAFEFLAFVAAVLGLIIGTVLAIRWVIGRGGLIAPWSSWIGTALGLNIAASLRFSGALGDNVIGSVISWLPGTILFFISLAFLGGCIGGAIETAIRSFRKLDGADLYDHHS